LNSAYILKDALKNLWSYTSKTWAGKHLEKWIGWANETEIKGIIRLSKGLNRDREELLSYCKHKVTSAKIESFNATIKRTIRKVCGYQDMECLYLKLGKKHLLPDKTLKVTEQPELGNSEKLVSQSGKEPIFFIRLSTSHLKSLRIFCIKQYN
jgi:hypothetical protein